MENLRLHSEEIDKNFSSLYFALYMQGEWGIEVGYKTYPAYLTNMRKRLCDFQELASGDCNNELFIASQGHSIVDCCGPNTTRVTTSNQLNCCPKGSTYNSTTGLCEGTITTPPAPGCTCYTITTNTTWYDYSISYCNGITGTLRVFPGAPQNICATAVPVVLGRGPSTSGSESRLPNGNCYSSSGSTYTCTPTTIVTSTSPTIPCPCCPNGYIYISLLGYCQGVSATDIVDPIECVPRCIDASGVYSPLIPCTDKVPDSIILQYPTTGDSPFTQKNCCDTNIFS